MRRAAMVGLLLLCGLGAGVAAGSEAARADFLSLHHYGLDQGLSQLAVNAIAEDSQGFLWVGTQEGLNRFDGHHFQVEYDVVTTDQGISSSSINALAVDQQQRLWIGTDDAGLAVRELRSGVVTNVRLRPDSSTQPAIQHILLGEDGSAWVGSETAIFGIDAALAVGPMQASAAPIVGMARSAGAAFALDRQCQLWKLQDDRIDALPRALPPGTRCAGLQTWAGNLWLASVDQGVFQLDADGQLLAQHQADSIRGVAVDLTTALITSDGRLLLGYADGVLVLAVLGAPWAPQPATFEQALQTGITRLFESRGGVLWLGSETRGLYRARSLSTAIRRDLRLEYGFAELPGDSVRSLWGDQSQWLVGTDQGLFWRAPGHADWQRIDSIGLTSVRKVLPDPAGGWWIGSHRGLWHLSTAGHARRVPGLPNQQVTDLLWDGEGLWVSTRGGLARVVEGEVRSDPRTSAVEGLFLTALMQDEQGRLWVGSDDAGLFRFSDGATPEQWQVSNGRLKHNSIWSLYRGKDASWIGSFGGGLLRIDRAEQAVTQLRAQDGLSNDVIYRIEPDAMGRLWLSSNRGLNVYEPASGEVRVLLPSDGLINREYNSGASFRDYRGFLYFGGTEGVDVIQAEALEDVSPIAQPVFTRLRILGRRGGDPALPPGPALERDLVYAEQIDLDYRESVFALGLVAIEFSAPESARLRYRIQGIHNDWVRPEQARTDLLLSYLPPGEYLLEAQAAGHVGEFGATRALRLHVGAPPWRQPWAYLLYAALSLIALTWLTTRIGASARTKRAQIAMLNQTVAERTAELEHANQLLLRSNRELERASRVDPLTQVSNRRDLQRWLQEQVELLGGETDARQHLLFCIVDIDDFKLINDKHGHQVGDEILVALAGRLNQLCREQDVVVRWGGEEFLLLVRSSELPDAPRIAERIRQAICDHAFVLESGKSLQVSCSVGFAPWPLLARQAGASNCEQSINLADRALYAAKGAGKNAWVGVLPGPALTAQTLGALLTGSTPAQLPAGSVQLLHSTAEVPSFPAGGMPW